MPQPSNPVPADAQPDQGRRPGARDRVAMTIAVAATVVGLWLGLVSPSDSPVTPPTPVAPVPTQVAPTPGTP